MAVASTDKLITLSNLGEFKTKYTEKYIGDIKLTKEGSEKLVTVKEYVDKVVETGGTGSVVSIKEITTGLASDVLKAYEFYQGDNTVAANKIGTINLAKDLVVTAGEVVKDPEGQAAGTYLKLTIANQTAPVFINVADLCDNYTAAQGATQVQLVVSSTNEISATIVAGSVTATELADAVKTDIAKGQTALNAIGTAKTEGTAGTGLTGRIEVLEDVGAQANVLEGVQVNGTDLAVADKKVNVTVATGSANGTLAVNSVDVAVKGLDEMAYEKKATYVAQADITLADNTTDIDALFA